MENRLPVHAFLPLRGMAARGSEGWLHIGYDPRLCRVPGPEKLAASCGSPFGHWLRRCSLRHPACAVRVPQAGFTLLEILLALALLSLVMLGVWGALASATRITHAADAVMARSENVRTVQQFLRRYVSAAELQPYVSAGGARARMFEGDATSMRYVAPLPMQSGHAGLYLQTISLRKNTSGSLTLELAYQPYTNDVPESTDPVKHLLLSDLQGGKFQYLAAAAFDKPAAWRDDWQAVSGLPLAVRIHLDPAWRARVAFPDMVIPLHSGEGFGAQIGGAP